jgi:hypothetical protein
VGQELHGAKVIGPLAAASELLDCYFVNGIGSPKLLEEKQSSPKRASLLIVWTSFIQLPVFHGWQS